LGSAYILVFSVAALPFGVLSDLRSRRAVISGGVTVWSAFTFLSGLVSNYWQLFICRAAVGVGEAAYGPAASSMVADYFPGPRRAVAMGILASGVALGGVLGLLLGGYLEALHGWRVAFMVVGLPGFICAVLVARLPDPARLPEKLTVLSFLRDFHIGAASLARQLWPLIAGVILGGAAAYWLDRYYGADSKLDIATLSAAVGIGLAFTIFRWVRRTPADPTDEPPFGSGIGGAFDDIVRAGKTVLHTPTLVYVFLAGALISFGLNGIVGWGPTFVSRELGLTAGEAAALLGKWGLIAGTAGTLFGGFLADWLRRRYETGRVITVALGLLLGGPLAFWLLTIRDLDTFKAVFVVAFFCLSWYNGPITAVIFDVVPPRISATVAGAYLLFIHLAGDAIALPLVGTLSDQFGLDRAILLLPVVVVAGGIVVLGAVRTLARDMVRVGAS
ncbi:MAG: MFS transporter, partial [Gemmatimonadales bacterium]|nr:MFS transporter [Gemmatimonadales bacterium]